MTTGAIAGTQSTKNLKLIGVIASLLGVQVDLSQWSGWKLTIESPTGQGAQARLQPRGPGAGGPTLIERWIEDSAFVVPAGTTQVIDAGIESGASSALVASTLDIVVPNAEDGSAGCPVGSLVYATVASAAGKPKLLAAVRKDDNTITVSSSGSGFGAVLDSAGVSGTCVASTVDIALANVAGDQFTIKETTPGGTAADHFSAFRVNDTTVRVQAHTAAGALVAGNTSVVKVHNVGQVGHETSTVRWVVVRP